MICDAYVGLPPPTTRRISQGRHHLTLSNNDRVRQENPNDRRTGNIIRFNAQVHTFSLARRDLCRNLGFCPIVLPACRQRVLGVGQPRRLPAPSSLYPQGSRARLPSCVGKTAASSRCALLQREPGGGPNFSQPFSITQKFGCPGGPIRPILRYPLVFLDSSL